MGVTVTTTIGISIRPTTVGGFPSGITTVSDVKDTVFSKWDQSFVSLVASPDLSIMPQGMTKATQVYVKCNGTFNLKVTPVGGSAVTVPCQDLIILKNTGVGFSALAINGSGDAEVAIFGE